MTWEDGVKVGGREESGLVEVILFDIDLGLWG